jgi:hypothetical protein
MLKATLARILQYMPQQLGQSNVWWVWSLFQEDRMVGQPANNWDGTLVSKRAIN